MIRSAMHVPRPCATPSTARRGPVARRVVIAVMGVALSTSCGGTTSPGSGGQVAAGAPGAPSAPQPGAASAAPTSAPLPTLPPIGQGRADAFDPDGCLATPSGAPRQQQCTTTASQLDAQRAGTSETDWRDLAGFSGRRYTTDLTRGAVVVLDDTVAAAGAGLWSAQGLVRNETASAIADLSVTAQLVDASGTVLETVAGRALVRGVRPGEPAPFVLASTSTDVGLVRSVRWTAGVDAAGAGLPSRGFEIATFWTRPQGGRVMEGDLHKDGGDPSSHLVFGSATSVGDATAGADVTAAWLDEDGRVVAVAVAPGWSSGTTVATAIAPGGFADFLLEVKAPVAAALADLTPMLWVVGR